MYKRLPDACRPMPKTKVEVPYERIETKVPLGLYEQLEEAVRTRRTWGSRQDFVIEAIKEKLERMDVQHSSGRTAARR